MSDDTTITIDLTEQKTDVLSHLLYALQRRQWEWGYEANLTQKQREQAAHKIDECINKIYKELDRRRGK